MAANIYDWSTTAADNDDADGGINWEEGQAPSTVNGSARAMMARVAALLRDIGGSLTSSGTDTITLTANNAFSALQHGMVVAFKAGGTNTGAATLNVNSTGAKAVKVITTSGEADVSANDIYTGGHYLAQYDSAAASGSGAWILLNRTTVAAHTHPVAQLSDASANGRSLISAADYAAMKALLDLEIGTDVQAYAANLAAFAALSLIADRLPYANGTGTLALATFTSAARNLLDDADAATMRATLGAAAISGQTFTGNIIAGSGVGSSAAFLEIGLGRSADGAAYVDLIADATTYTDYSFRLNRAAGSNGSVQVINRGTGDFSIETVEAAKVVVKVAGSQHSVFAVDGSFQMGSGPDTVITASRHPQLRSYTVATQPSATTAAQLIYVSDGAGSRRLAFSDGTNWRLVFDDADLELSALAGLTSAANKLPYFTGSGTASLADFSSFGRSLVDDADATAARATLGAAAIAGQTFTGNIIVGSGVGSGAAFLEVGFTRSADGTAYVDLIADATTYTDYCMRITRASGSNGAGQIIHRGTGNFSIETVESSPVVVKAANSQHTVFATDGSLQMGASPSTVVSASRHHQLRSYTVATLPSAATAGQLIYVSDGTSNKRLAVSDATNWRFPDGNIVS